MVSFIDASISEPEARLKFLNFLASKGLKMEKEFLNPKVNIYNGKIPNSLAEGNTSLENKCINFSHSPTIVTYWHELAHYSSTWKDIDGKIYSDYEYEKDFNTQYQESLAEPGYLDVKRGIHGRFWGEAAAEYRASEMAWQFDSNNTNRYFRTQNRTYYDEEIITMKTIAKILDLSDDEIFYKSNKNNEARTFMESRTENLTGNSRFWTLLESYLDYIEMQKVGKISMIGQPVLSKGRKIIDFSTETKKNFSKIRNEKIPQILSIMLELRRQNKNISPDKYKTLSEEIHKTEEILNSRNRTHI